MHDVLRPIIVRGFPKTSPMRMVTRCLNILSPDRLSLACKIQVCGETPQVAISTKNQGLKRCGKSDISLYITLWRPGGRQLDILELIGKLHSCIEQQYFRSLTVNSTKIDFMIHCTSFAYDNYSNQKLFHQLIRDNLSMTSRKQLSRMSASRGSPFVLITVIRTALFADTHEEDKVTK